MICCDVITKNFINQSTTTVSFTGDKPTVTVSYLIDGVWQASVAVVVQLLPDSVVVDHGGISTGIVKIIQ